MLPRREAYLKLLVGTIPLVVVGTDPPAPHSVGFATVGGKNLAYLGPLMFSVAQAKKKGCPWQLLNEHYVTVWMTVGGNAVHPLSLTNGLAVLKAAGWCAPDSDPYYTSDAELGYVWDRQDSPRKVYADPSLIPSVDEDLLEDE